MNHTILYLQITNKKATLIRPCTGTLRFEHPRDVIWRVAEGVHYSLVPTLSCFDIGVVLQFHEYLRLSKTIKDSGGLTTVLGMGY